MRSGDWTTYESPLGPLTLIGGAAGLRSIRFPGEAPALDAAAERPMPAAVAQLDAYFAGELKTFDLDLDLRGDRLQKLVWAQLLEIPHGETRSYGELAGRIDESAYPPGLEPYRRPRVVGAAIGLNPIAVVVPCHRVLGADGSLTGFRGGLERKRALLELEGWRAPARARAPKPAGSQLALL